MTRIVRGHINARNEWVDQQDIFKAPDALYHISKAKPDAVILFGFRGPGTLHNGELLLSVPNFGHWYPRSRVALGLFGYDRRGIPSQLRDVLRGIISGRTLPCVVTDAQNRRFNRINTLKGIP